MMMDEGQVSGEVASMLPETSSLLHIHSLSLSLPPHLWQDASPLLTGPGKPNMI